MIQRGNNIESVEMVKLTHVKKKVCPVRVLVINFVSNKELSIMVICDGQTMQGEFIVIDREV